MNTSQYIPNDPLGQFFRPKTIAVIGASSREQSIGWRLIYNLKSAGYPGDIYPINPKSDQILDCKAYNSILQINKTIDLVFIALAAENVVEALEQCEKAKAKYVIIISGGFAEVGDEGRKIQDYITDFAKRTGIRILGPNCQGAINFLDQTVMSFSRAVDFGFIKGSAAIVSQSGATGHALYNMALEKGLGLAYLATTGNEADLSMVDFFDYFLEDPNVKTIASYSEGFKRPKALLKIGRKSLANHKPIIIMKQGKSAVAQKAISSHTAALAGSDQLFNALLKQAGIIRVNDVDELLDTTYVFSILKMRPAGRRIAICTTTGGAGVMLADACAEFGLVVPDLQPETIGKLAQVLPLFATAQNPLDATTQVINDAGSFTMILSIIVEDSGIDALIVGIGTGSVGKAAETRAKVIKSVAERVNKPILVAWVTGENSASPGVKVLNEAGVPAFHNPWRCARAINHVLKFEEFIVKGHKKTKYEQQNLFNKAKKLFANGKCVLLEYEAKQFMAEAGFTTVRERLVQTAQEAVAAANEFGYPVVLKINSPQILHKTESGGVKLNLVTANEVADAFESILANVKAYNPQAEINGVLVQEMVTTGVEVILGSTFDPQLGPAIMFGMGGVYVELARDVTFRLPPLTKDEALEMIADTNIAYSVLSGARGRTPSDIDALAELISRFSYLVCELGDNVEVDLNPVIVMSGGQGYKIVDALIIKKDIIKEERCSGIVGEV